MTRKGLLTEAAAWRKMAKWCANKAEANQGLCYILRWEPPGAVKPVSRDMGHRLEYHTSAKDVSLDGYLGAYLHRITPRDEPHTPTPDARVIFCLLMALECEQEARERLR